MAFNVPHPLSLLDGLGVPMCSKAVSGEWAVLAR